MLYISLLISYISGVYNNERHYFTVFLHNASSQGTIFLFCYMPSKLLSSWNMPLFIAGIDSSPFIVSGISFDIKHIYIFFTMFLISCAYTFSPSFLLIFHIIEKAVKRFQICDIYFSLTGLSIISGGEY